MDGEGGGGSGEEEDDMEGVEDKNDDNVIKKLRELAEVVEVCLHSNPGMQSTVLIEASKNLLKTYQSKWAWENTCIITNNQKWCIHACHVLVHVHT